MEEDTIEKFKIQHFENYKRAINELVINNTNILVDDDILSLIKKPPLDSMDTIKSKFLEVAKKNKVIINIEELENILLKYRNKVGNFQNIKDIRIEEIKQLIDNFKPIKEFDVFKITKKDLLKIDRKLKKQIKEKLIASLEETIIKNVNFTFTDKTPADVQKKIVTEIIKYLKGSYLKQLLESIDFKILVKDTTLINGIKEHGERYLFTKENSYIFRNLED